MVSAKRTNERRQYLLANLDNIYLLLGELEVNPHIPFMQFMRKSQLSGGSFASAIADARILGYVKNGDGLSLTDIGKEYLLTKSASILREQALKVPMFRRCYDELGSDDVKSYSVVKKWFADNRGKYYTQQFTGSVARRFYECVNGYTPRRRIIKKSESEIANQTNLLQHSQLRNIKQVFISLGLTPQEMRKMAYALPEEKRDRLLDELLK